MKKTKIINLFGGPGSGKSTTASGIFNRMKLSGCSVELVQEFAKDLVWQKRWSELNNQVYVTAIQYQRQAALIDKVDYIVTDSPVLLGQIYTPENYFSHWNPLVKEMFDSFDNINFVLTRKPNTYDSDGRRENEDSAKDVDIRIVAMLDELSVEYNTIESGNIDAVFRICKYSQQI